jgi:hypothetical protein
MFSSTYSCTVLMLRMVPASNWALQSGAFAGNIAGTYSLYRFLGFLLASLAQALPKQANMLPPTATGAGR